MISSGIIKWIWFLQEVSSNNKVYGRQAVEPIKNNKFKETIQNRRDFLEGMVKRTKLNIISLD